MPTWRLLTPMRGPVLPAVQITPLTIFEADLVGWYKADTGVYVDAGTTPATNGQTVQQWNDQSGYNHHATQATSGSRPTLNTTGFNSLPTLEFVSDFMTSGVDAFALGTGATACAFWAGRINTGGQVDFARFVSYLGNGSTADFDNVDSFIFGYCAGGPTVLSLRNNMGIASNDFTFDTNRRWTSNLNDASSIFYLDNVGGAPGNGTLTPTSPGTLLIGAGTVSGTSPAVNHAFSEIVVIKRAATAGERTSMDDYFKTKWGLS